MTFVTGVCLIIQIKLRIYKSSNPKQIKEYMNRLKSLMIGGLLAAASIAALSQNASAAEVKYQHEHLNRNTVAFNNSKLVREQHARELRERQAREQHARELRERQAREQRARELRERQAREQRARELRERQARLYH
ncbi:hypothetical protein I8752_18405 [Nostocaceae cyanobacterium CENA369]|uniref:Uncharacterized protein n=1 Tax=Dendronalium phyllosphericum CENA369 TaxID=1725256 RepID=A0A8J7ICM9_9NOST|nr:DUF1682 domain-containing protein [Dendronalium phyllosphericum]MBH8574952.1 hypothetical protein [Dendronalium phyllosphericum CENA369]